MSDFYCTIRTSNTWNNTPSGHQCPTQFYAQIGRGRFDSFTKAKKLHLNIIPDEMICCNSIVFTGIDDNMPQRIDLDNALSQMSKLLKSLEDKDIYVLGWDLLGNDFNIINKNFERKFGKLACDVDRIKMIDVKTLFQDLVPIEKIGNYTLDACTLYTIQNDQNSISSWTTLKQSKVGNYFTQTEVFEVHTCLAWCMKELQIQTLDEVYSRLSSPHEVKILSFGKHKGQDIRQVFDEDPDYIQWLSGCNDVLDKNPSLKMTLEKLMKESVDSMIDSESGHSTYAHL